MGKYTTVLKKLLIFLLQIWSTLFAISFIQSIMEGVNRDNKTTITKGKYKEWKPKKWKQPDSSTKQE
jgi:hypothetical protein